MSPQPRRQADQSYYHSWGAFDRTFVPQAETQPSTPTTMRRLQRDKSAEPSVESGSLIFEPTPYDYDEIPAPNAAYTEHGTLSYTDLRPGSRGTVRSQRRQLPPQSVFSDHARSYTDARPDSRITERPPRRPMAPEPFTVSGGPSHASSSSGSGAPATPRDTESLDNVWSQVRHRKVRELQGQPSKVESLETYSGSGTRGREHKRERMRRKEPTVSHTPTVLPIPFDTPSSIMRADSHRRRRQQSDGVVHFEDSADGQWVVATFTLGVPRRDVDAYFKADRGFTVNWHTVHETERVEGSVVYREREERHHSRTMQVPERTTLEDIQASYHPRDGRLIIKYPKARTVRAKPQTLRGRDTKH